MNAFSRHWALVAVFALSSGALFACGKSAAAPNSGADGGGGPPGSDAGDGDSGGETPCFTNPQTYLQIINACTDAQAIDKNVDLSPMSLRDGGLSPLP